MSSKHSLYNKTVEIAEGYLGPAGERFIQRQISTHLKIEPASLNKRHLSKLIDWSSIAFSLITHDEKDINSFTRELKLLAANNNKTNHAK